MSLGFFSFAAAISAYEHLLAQDLDNDLRAQVIFSLMEIYAAGYRNFSMSGAIIARMENEVPGHDMIDLARWTEAAFSGEMLPWGEGLRGRTSGLAQSPSANTEEFELGPNFPNPFNPTTSITYTIPQAVHVTLEVYDVLGREVISLVDGFMEAGRHTVEVDGSMLASGVYFYKLGTPSFSTVRKMLVIK